MTKHSILIVGPPSLGYLEKISNELDSYDNVEVALIEIDRFSFKYKNTWHRIQNAFLKLLFKRNLKKEYVNTYIIEQANKKEHYDIIFTIRPDLLKESTLEFLKTKTDSLEAFYYDSTRRFPNKVKIIPLFDKVYSYDRLDVDHYGLNFLTNYIYSESKASAHKFQFFNISTFDYRFPAIEKLAAYIESKGWSKNMMVLGSDDLKSEVLTIIHEQIPVDEVAKSIEQSKIIIEVQRKEQIGLSFRVFEALGHRKKLVTTNGDVVNYDFYNPQNILVVDEDDIQIPESFVTSDYVPIDDEILDHYRLNTWVKRVFDLS